MSVSLLKEGNKTLIRIADSGIGIIDAIQSKIFNEYVEGHTLGTIGEQGSGLGLSIVKMIIDAHGFDINFTSVRNEGTEFVIVMEGFGEIFFQIVGSKCSHNCYGRTNCRFDKTQPRIFKGVEFLFYRRNY
ncbi:MAG: hypothetical protein B6I19_03925 [Bacteroidetes bacterium 4572_114]|nr:MAG: hypothetical protein B6I19_03925 [Bacteroidetes bacterium 4572_114]